MDTRRESVLLALVLVPVLALGLAACPGAQSPEPSGSSQVTDSFFWGHWVRMDQEERWYVADSKVSQGDTAIPVESATSARVVAGAYTLERQSDNVLMVNGGAFFLYRSRGARGVIKGSVTGGVAGARGLGPGVASVSLLLRNVGNALNEKKVAVGADGNFSIDSIVPTDEYRISTLVTKGDGSQAEGPSLTVSTKSMEEDIGTIRLVDLKYNFKVSMDVPAGLLYAGGGPVPVTIRVRNIGTEDSKGANYEFPAQDGITIASSTNQILGTIKPGAEKTISATIECGAVSGEFEDKLVKVSLSDAYNNVWNDQVSIRFYKREMTFNFASLGNSVYGVVMTPEKEGHWFATTAAGGSLYAATIQLPWRERGYVVALSRATVATECQYSIGIDAAAADTARMQALKKTSAFEPNDVETAAAGIAMGDSIVAYLHDEDIDFYAVGGRAASPLASPGAGAYDNAQTVALSCATAGAAIRYTLDGSLPTEASALYAAPVAIEAPSTLKAVAFVAGLDPSNALEAGYSFKAATPLLAASGQSWTMSCATAGAEIRYTTDGGDPTGSSALYSAASPVSASGVVKARAYKSGWTPSDIAASSGAPAASFTTDPASPTVGRTVSFDASATSDDDTAAASIEVRWDFDGDGTFDTSWSATRTATHAYAAEGSYVVRLEARDKNGIVGSTTKTFAVGAAAALPRDSLVAEFLLDGNAADASGKGNDGTVYGAAAATDRFGRSGKAMNFDGTGDYIQLPRNLGLRFPWSFSGWVKASDVSAVRSIYCSDRHNWYGGDYNGFNISLCSDNYYAMIGCGVPMNNGYSTSVAPSRTAFEHVAVVFKSITEVEYYVNGVKRAVTTSGGYDTPLFPGSPDRIGRSYDGNGRTYFSGVLDDIRVYGRALSAAEVQALFGEGGWTGAGQSGDSGGTSRAWKKHFYHMEEPYGGLAGSASARSSFTKAWSTGALGDYWPCLLTGDVNGDSKLEVVASLNGTARIYSSAGSTLGSFALPSASTSIAMLADLDGDGKDELFSGGGASSTTIRAYGADGTLKRTFQGPSPGDSIIWPAALVDGKLYAKVTTGYSGQPRGLLRFTAATGAQDWFFSIGGAAAYFAAVADADGDGSVEIALGNSTVNNGVTGSGWNGNATTTDDGSTWVVVVNQDGTPRLVQRPGGLSISGVIRNLFYDYGGDGSKEVLACSMHIASSYTGTDQIRALSLSTGAVLKTVDVGTNQWYWTPLFDSNRVYAVLPVSSTIKTYDASLNLLGTTSSVSFNNVCFINDVDGDGAKEICVADASSVKVLNCSTWATEHSIPFSGNFQQCIVSDLDGDGKNEIIVYDGSLAVYGG